MRTCHQKIDQHDELERLVIDDENPAAVPSNEGKIIQNALSDNNNDFEANEQDFKKDEKFLNGDYSLQQLNERCTIIVSSREIVKLL